MRKNAHKGVLHEVGGRLYVVDARNRRLIMAKAPPKKVRKRPPAPAKNLAAQRDGVPNAPNVLWDDTLWKRDGTWLPRAAVDEMRKKCGR